MTSSRPYLIRAIYEWLTDNRMTPYIMVDAKDEMTRVPKQYIENGKIVLNVESNAIANLRMGNQVIEFDARFSGVAHHLYIPVRAVKAIYAFENGRGMIFNDDDEGGDVPPSPEPVSPGKKTGRPNLKIVKSDRE